MKRIFTSAAITLAVLLSLSTGSFAQTPKTVGQELTPDRVISLLMGAKPADKKSGPAEGLFYFSNEVSETTVLSLVKQLESWVEDTDNAGKPIRIILNSPGGSVFASFTLMDEIAAVRTRGHHVKIQTYGMAASAAGWLLQAADERVIGANSWILIHQISTKSEGKLFEIQNDMKLSTQLQDQFLERLAKRSKLSLATIHEHIDQGLDWWINAQDALKYGLVDSIEPVPGFAPNK
jgi:ATP-dependent Clp endopeptidase proteolytic subunit ClpP